MTYQGQPSTSTNTVLKVLVAGLIIWVAYWAATGGLDEIAIPAPAEPTTSSTLAG